MFLSIIQDLIVQNQGLFRLICSILILFVFWALKAPAVKLAVRLLSQAVNRKRERISPDTLAYVLTPLKAFLGITGLYLGLENLFGAGSSVLLVKCYRIAFIFTLAWISLRLTDRVSGSVFSLGSHLDQELDIRLNQTLMTFLQKLVKVLVLCVAGIAILSETGADVSTLITGLGLGGLTFALAAQDTASNLFGGLVILLDKPFGIGDWISTPSLEGVVEDIAFRSTRIRTFEDSLIIVPNNTLTSASITNWSRMNKRQISFAIGVTYNTSAQQLHTVVERIDKLLRDSPEIHPDTIVVNFHSFGESSLNLAVYCFAAATSMAAYRRTVEGVNFGILAILEEEGVALAFPTRTVELRQADSLPPAATAAAHPAKDNTEDKTDD